MNQRGREANQPALPPECTAVFELLGRAGAQEVQLRWQDDEEPMVWIAVFVSAQGAECASALNPVEAMFRLAEQLMDGGGQCTHCNRPTIFLRYHTDAPLPLPFDACAYQFDPELVTYRRSCEGDA